MKRFGHRAKIRHDARALRRTQRNRHGALLCVQLMKRGARGSRANRTQDTRWMPTFGVVMLRIATRELGPDFITHRIGHDHVFT